MKSPNPLLMGVPVPWVFVVYLNGAVIPVEEAKLEQVFPDEYEQYYRRVGRWI